MLRIDDLDSARVVEGSRRRQMEDLMWLGLHWDEGPESAGIGAPYSQSQAMPHYDDAFASLHRRGMLYPCDCSRKEIASLLSAPHEGEEITYSGACRASDPHRVMRRAPAWRLRVDPDAEETFCDLRLGTLTARVVDSGDFVLRRADGTYTYQFACSIDDGRGRITDVVRGEDLCASTARQRYLQGLLGLQRPRTYVHIPTIVGPDGERLAKRHGAPTVRAMREAGQSPASVVGAVAYLLGMQEAPLPAVPSTFLGMIPPRGMARPYLLRVR